MTEAETSRKAVQRAFMLMERHGFDFTPAHLLAWYSYALGRDGDLVRRMDQLVESKGGLTPDRLDEIICHIIVGQTECRRLFQGVEGVHSAIQIILKELGASEGQTEEFCRALGATSSRLEKAQNLDEVRHLVVDVVGMMNAVVERQRELAQSLQEASEEVVLLRNRLDEVYRQAITDDLTGLKNRRFFDARLRELADEAEQTGHGLVLMLFDIDHFKQFNDKHGHATGDNVLKLVAGIIRSATRETDVAARIGGEEFGVVLRRISQEDAFSLAERIRQTLGSRNLVTRGSSKTLGRITISGGVCSYVRGMGTEGLFAAADQALYRAKREGRNRVVA